MDVAGAFHTSLMDSACLPCEEALNSIGIMKPRINVMSNVTGTVHTTAREIKRLLVEQINHPVHWEQILHRLYMRPDESSYPSTIAVGPGTSLGPILKRVNAPAFQKYRDISV